MKLKRRLLVAFLSVVCIAAGALCFTACGTDEETANIDGKYMLFISHMRLPKKMRAIRL